MMLISLAPALVMECERTLQLIAKGMHGAPEVRHSKAQNHIGFSDKFMAAIRCG